MKRDVLTVHPELALRPQIPLRQAMETMTRLHRGLVAIVDSKRKLLGVITDMDIRSALLKGVDVEDSVEKVMNRSPASLSAELSDAEIAEAFRRAPHAYMPVVDKARRLKGIAALSDYLTVPELKPNWVVVMAGGRGTRLGPLTRATPKPMLKVGERPLLELLVEQFTTAGFSRFLFAVNYLADQIQSHFGDGSRFGAQIEYVRESKPLGTAGALSLIRRKFDAPLLVVNGDILTKVDFNALLEFHRHEKGLATICVREHLVQVPYGVVELSGRRLDAFVEKPTQRYLVNAGIYVLEPKALTRLERGKPCDMPTLLKAIGKSKRGGVACFPVQEYWLDIGGPREFAQAAGDYAALFDK